MRSQMIGAHTSEAAREIKANEPRTEISPAELTIKVQTTEAKGCNDKWWTIGATVVTALFTVVLGIFTILLWRETRKTAKFAGLTVKEMQCTAERQLRAYLFVRAMEFTIWNNQRIVCSIHTENAGQTPANNITCIGTIHISNQSTLTPDELDSLSTSQLYAGVIHPHTAYQCSVEKINNDPQEVNALIAGTKFLHLFGIIKYTDAFNVQRETKFCFLASNIQKTKHDKTPQGAEIYTAFFSLETVHNEAT